MCFCRAFIGWRGSLRRPAWFAGPQLEQAFTMAPSPATPVEPSSGYLLFLLTRKMFCFFKFKEVTFMNHKTIHPSTCSTTVLHSFNFNKTLMAQKRKVRLSRASFPQRKSESGKFFFAQFIGLLPPLMIFVADAADFVQCPRKKYFHVEKF